jgi:catechol 2,3-dioxygenase-like lactoylglutathione lyase family enzyme
MSFQSEGDIVSLVVSLHHVQITVPQGSENAARDFYCGLLGLREIEKPQKLLGRGGFWLDLNGTQVHVGTEEGIDRRKTKAHLAYEVGDLDAACRLLESAGFETSKGSDIPGISRFESRDPFGNRLEFVQRLE